MRHAISGSRSLSSRVTGSLAAALAAMLLGGHAPAQVAAPASLSCNSLTPDAPGSCSGERLDYPNRAPAVELGTVGILRPGRVGAAYNAVVIRGGVPGYTFAEPLHLPPGISFRNDGRYGRLTGTPTKAGSYAPHVVARDSAVPAHFVRGDWTMRVEAARRPVIPAAPPRKPGIVAVECPPAAVPPVRVSVPGEITYYRLGVKDLALLSAVPLADPPAGIAGVAPRTTGQPVPARCQPAPLVPRPAGAVPSRLTLAASVVAPIVPSRAVPLRLAVSVPAHLSTSPADLAATSGHRSPILPDMSVSPTLPNLLRPMAEIEYPTRAAFEASVRYHLGGFTVPAGVRQQVTGLAARRDNFGLARHPAWQGEDNCNCVAAPGGGEYRIVYGFLPFWRASAKETAEHPVDFSLFDRIGFLGLQLNDDGDWTGGLDPQIASDFARTAQSRGTRLDLVLQRSQWFQLSGLSEVQLRALAERASSRAVQEADQRIDLRWRDIAMIGPWWSPRHVYDGITVMFTPPQRFDYASAEPLARDTAAFGVFYREFMRTLIAGMHETGRQQSVAIVLDSQSFCRTNRLDAGCEAGAFSVEHLLEYRDLALASVRAPVSNPVEAAVVPMAQRVLPVAARTPVASPDAVPVRASGGSFRPLGFRLLVIVPEFAGDNKKRLRLQIDELNGPLYDGKARIALLHSIVPIVFHHGSDPKNLPSPTVKLFQGSRTAADLDYYLENFGGVAFWPVPMAGIGDSDEIVAATRSAIADVQAPHLIGLPVKDASFAWLTATQCNPAVRLAWEVGIVLVLFGYVLYFYREDSERLQSWYFWVASGVAAVVILLSLLLLTTDPTLAALSRGNTPLFILVLIVGAAIAYALLKRAVRAP